MPGCGYFGPIITCGGALIHAAVGSAGGCRVQFLNRTPTVADVLSAKHRDVQRGDAVTFTLKVALGNGTVLTVVECGFDNISPTDTWKRSALTPAAGKGRWSTSCAMSRSLKSMGAGKRDAGLRAMVQLSEALANLFAALGDPTRLKLVAVLRARGSFSIAHLTA